MEESDRRQPHILVIDDNPGDTQLLRMALENAGVNCQLTELDNGRDALDFIGRCGRFADAPAPDLVVLDLNLPRNDGLEILEALRASENFPEVPVAILSSSSSTRDRSKVLALQVKRFIVKPPDLDAYMKIGATLAELLG